MGSCEARALTGLLLLALLTGCGGSFGDGEAEGDAAGALTDGPGRSPLAEVGRGLSSTLEASARSLEDGRRAAAMMGLNRALHLAEVARHAAHGAHRRAFEQVSAGIRSARRSVQNGQPELAPPFLLRAATLAAEAAAVAPEEVPFGPLPELDLQIYQGATVLDADGARIGEIDGWVGPAAAPTAAVVTVGSWQNTLGFLDLGGRAVRVPIDRLLFGPDGLLGETTVAFGGRIPSREPGR